MIGDDIMKQLPFKKNISFWSILKSNLKCAFCKEKNCRVRYYPGRKNYTFFGGTRYVDECKKDVNKRFDRILKKKLP